MYIQQEKQNRQADWIPAFAGLKALRELSVKTGTTTDANTNLKKLSNDQLLSQTKNLVQKERQINILVLQHLQEIENLKSRLWAFQGFLQSV